MINIDENFSQNELRRQNPWWEQASIWPEDPQKNVRGIFPEIQKRVRQNDLITAITGLRRVGKTTLLKQIINDLIATGEDRRRLLYFSFEELTLSKSPDILSEMIDRQLKNFPQGKLYFFLDEIQYVDFWNAVLKKYVDLYPRLKFVISGSSSLFIRTKARESLAGRIQEIFLPPLSFGEYLLIAYGQKLPMAGFLPEPEALFDYREILKEKFIEYLYFGEFPYLAKLDGFAEKKEYVLDWVVGKILRQDLPELRRIVRGPEFANLGDVLIEGSGQLVELQNLAADLGINRLTLSHYLSLLEESYLTKQIFNEAAGFRSRGRRQRKVYGTSVNAVALKTSGASLLENFSLRSGQIVETFVANYLQRFYPGRVLFWRYRQEKEVDFLVKRDADIVPVEVKFQPRIKKEDVENLVYFCRKEKIGKAVIVTKEEAGIRDYPGLKIKLIPAHYLI
ncbi:MAG: ATP-binding protein [bacterium]|nr:ATP-binding protein [bacterium]